MKDKISLVTDGAVDRDFYSIEKTNVKNFILRYQCISGGIGYPSETLEKIESSINSMTRSELSALIDKHFPQKRGYYCEETITWTILTAIAKELYRSKFLVDADCNEEDVQCRIYEYDGAKKKSKRL